ncbi:MAG: hypothetical protein AAF984_01450 [Verrucomicrobiota bacterium]
MAKKDFSSVGVASLVLSLFLLMGVLTWVIIENSSISYKAEGAEDTQADQRYETLAKLQEEDVKELEGLDKAMDDTVGALRSKTVQPIPMASPPIPTNIKSPAYKKDTSI